MCGLIRVLSGYTGGVSILGRELHEWERGHYRRIPMRTSAGGVTRRSNGPSRAPTNVLGEHATGDCAHRRTGDRAGGPATLCTTS